MPTFRRATDADFAEIIAVINAQTGGSTAVEQYTEMVRNRPAGRESERFVAYLPDGRFAGYAYVGIEDETERNFSATVRVDEPCRRQGVGTGLLRLASDWARARGAARLEATLDEKQAEALTWAVHRGFVTEGLVTRAVLKLAGWEPDPFVSSVVAAEAEGIRFTTLAEVGVTEENLRRFYDTCKALEGDVPGRAPKFAPYDLWRRQIETDPAWDPACILLALDGDAWAAISFFEKQTDGSWYTHLTGVHPAHRGRGLGMAVKVAAVQLAHECGVPYISTYNHIINAPMVAINRQLGYQATETLVQMHLPL